jgi:hypothetical protein
LTEGSCLCLPHPPSAPPSSSTAPRSTLPVRLSRISLSTSSRANDYGGNHIFQVYLHMYFQVHTCVRRCRRASPCRRRTAPPLWWSIRGCSRGTAALRSLRARPQGGRRLERTRRINGPPSRTMVWRPCLRPTKSKGKEAWQAKDTDSRRVRCLSIPNDIGTIRVVVDVRANRRVHVPKDSDVPLRIEVARGDAVLRGYLCKVESVRPFCCSPKLHAADPACS